MTAHPLGLLLGALGVGLFCVPTGNAQTPQSGNFTAQQIDAIREAVVRYHLARVHAHHRFFAKGQRHFISMGKGDPNPSLMKRFAGEPWIAPISKMNPRREAIASGRTEQLSFYVHVDTVRRIDANRAKVVSSWSLGGCGTGGVCEVVQKKTGWKVSWYRVSERS